MNEEILNNITIVVAALLPVALLLIYIYRKDKNMPEPVGVLLKAFGMGVLSAPLSFCVSVPLSLLGLYTSEPDTMFGAVAVSFFGAAIPEEIAKLFVLWLVLRKNPYFDEKMDGIVYAVCVSMGFAAFENVMYLFSNVDSYISVAATRALFAVPGHFCFGILMGYYYSLAKFYPKSPIKNRLYVFIAPVVAHGLYDSILFTANLSGEFAVLLFVFFLLFCIRMWKRSHRKIKEHLERDKEIDPF